MANKIFTLKNLKKALSALLIVSLLTSMVTTGASAAWWDNDDDHNNNSSGNYEYVQVIFNGSQVYYKEGPKNNFGWLIQGEYKNPSINVNGNVLSYDIGNQEDTVDLPIPQGYTISEYDLSPLSINSQAERYDNAIITITVSEIKNESTGEEIPVDPTKPIETEPETSAEPEETEPEVTEPTSLPVKFFVLNPNRIVPEDGADQGIQAYYPSGSYNYWNQMYTYEANITGGLSSSMLEALANSDGDGKLDIGDTLLVTSNDGISMPGDWQGLWSTFDLTPGTVSITAYVVKVQNPNDFAGSNGNYYGYDERGQKADIHVDCFVSNMAVNVIYHPNFNGAVGSFTVDEITGNYHDVRSYGETGLPERDGYTFRGWATAPNGGASYDASSTFQVVGYADLYAVWDKNPEVTEPVETEPVETEPVETEPVETEPVETEPVETEPVETEPVETEPVETEPVETEPVETEPVETEPVETEPVETEPVETEPVETEPVETEPVETEPVETEPVETEPVETEPVETEPVETEPVETEPVETEAPEYWPPYIPPYAPDPGPVETEPVETEPVETEPVETEPEVEIDLPDDDVPLADLPEEEAPVVAETEEVTEAPVEEPVDKITEDEEFVDLLDDEVPLTDIPDEAVPQTGDSAAWFIVSGVSAIGLAAVCIFDRKKKEQA